LQNLYDGTAELDPHIVDTLRGEFEGGRALSTQRQHDARRFTQRPAGLRPKSSGAASNCRATPVACCFAQP
jgi:hypothetical protein